MKLMLNPTINKVAQLEQQLSTISVQTAPADAPRDWWKRKVKPHQRPLFSLCSSHTPLPSPQLVQLIHNVQFYAKFGRFPFQEDEIREEEHDPASYPNPHAQGADS